MKKYVTIDTLKEKEPFFSERIKSFKDKTKNDQGITLIALVVTIVVLLILAGITITFVLGENGIINMAKRAAETTNQAMQNEQGDFANLQNYMNEAINGIGTKPTTARWTQDKTIVTNGTVTLEVGQAVSGYTANGVEDGKWCVLGAKDGKLLITTNSDQGTIELTGEDGYSNGVNRLNEEGAKFTDGIMAELARSMDEEDVNRVTGYDPDMANDKDIEDVDQWKNIVTYTLGTDDKIHYQGTKYPTTEAISRESSFTYYNGTDWITLKNEPDKNSVTLTHNFYYYYPQTLSTDASKDSETKINGSTKAYNLLFTNASDNQRSSYWLASRTVRTIDGSCTFSIRSVTSGFVTASRVVMSNGNPGRLINGLRPVVSLKSDVKVTSDGTLSL